MRFLPVSLLSVIAFSSVTILIGNTPVTASTSVGKHADIRQEIGHKELPFTFTYEKFGTYSKDQTATTYDSDLVPEGAEALTFVASDKFTGTQTSFWVTGFMPNHEYGAHAHLNACGPSGADAGPHFQYEQDPDPLMTDPDYANPHNEIWLDFTTNDKGEAFSSSHVTWTFEERVPASIVIHEQHTSTESGHAGEAGDRLACINVNF